MRTTAGTAFAALTLFAASLTAQTFDRTKPPASPDPRPYKLPSVYETKLPNGLTVLLAEDSRVPLVTMRGSSGRLWMGGGG